MAGGCEVVMEWGPGNTIVRQCGKPVAYRYAAMGGGYMHLCEHCGARHANYSERLVDGVWTETPGLAATKAAAPQTQRNPDRAFGAALAAWMADKGYTNAMLAEMTGYAESGINQFRMGWNLSRRARAKLREAGFNYEEGKNAF